MSTNDDKYLVLRGKNKDIYFIQKRLSKGLSSLIGKDFVKKSLETTNLEEAREKRDMILNELKELEIKVLAKNKFTNSRIRIIFQPAEEIAQGANWMRAEKVLEGVQALFGVHVYPDLPVGMIGIRSGTFTAAAAELEIDIIGNGGHGARPHEGIDSIWISAKVISGLQEAISRRLDDNTT